jgi:hypothetical protein
MRLDASYNLCSKLGSNLNFRRSYNNFSFTEPFLDFDHIFLSDLFLKVGPNKIYARDLLPSDRRGGREGGKNVGIFKRGFPHITEFPTFGRRFIWWLPYMRAGGYL